MYFEICDFGFGIMANGNIWMSRTDNENEGEGMEITPEKLNKILVEIWNREF